ncbi:MAG: hypothetical protein OEO71_12680 [Gammaproteobacteria bacterium]|nr:hypothetical protein [Gammaproteobacteria bacterium]
MTAGYPNDNPGFYLIQPQHVAREVDEKMIRVTDNYLIAAILIRMGQTRDH